MNINDKRTSFERPAALLAGLIAGLTFGVTSVPAGATITDKPHERPWGIYSGYFGDPDGHLWEVIWNPRFSPPA